MSKTAPDPLKNLIITVPLLSEPTIQKFKDRFQSVHLHPDGKVPSEVAKKADVWFASFTGFPESVKVLEDIPRLKLLQVISGMPFPLASPPLPSSLALPSTFFLAQVRPLAPPFPIGLHHWAGQVHIRADGMILCF